LLALRVQQVRHVAWRSPALRAAGLAFGLPVLRQDANPAAPD